MRDAILTAAVTGRLVPQDPTDTPATKLLADLGLQPINSAELPAPAAGWAWTTIEAVAADDRRALAIGPFGSNLKVSDYEDDGVPLVFVRNIRRRDFRSDLKYVNPVKAAELIAHQVEHGDVLVTKMGDPPGDTAIYSSSVPAIITADCIKITCGRAMIPAFMALAISTGKTRQMLLGETRGVAQKKVSLGRFRGLPLPVPPLDEQARIVAEVERQMSFLEACERAVDVGLARSAGLRRSVLKAAFEGRLVPQDPADEPASVLLDQIRAERAVQPAARRRARQTA
jgi:type I restriction enzyme S subunit